MILFNKTKNKIITKNLKIAKTFSDNLFGLLAEKVPLIKEKNDAAILFNTRFGIHTFFMKYPIAVIVLTNENKQSFTTYKVIGIKKNIRPNNFFFWNPRYSKIIELSNLEAIKNISLNETIEIR